MAVYLVSSEPRGRTLQHSEEPSAGVVLCTKEYADEHTLMHYRVGGEKKGVRRWQNENGSYTKAGYEHYAEMYGWNKLRADHAEKKAAKYEDKAKKAEAELHKQQVKVDKAQVKVDRKGNEKNIQKSQAATNKLHEAQLRFDQYRNKAEKYQSKTDRLHDKWDEQTKKLEEKAETARNSEAEMRYWKQQTEAEGKGSGEAHDKYEKLEKKFAAAAEKYDQELSRRGIEPKGSIEDEKRDRTDRQTDRDRYEAENNKVLDDAEREAEERVENNRYVEGSRAFRENAENERRMQDFNNLSDEDKRKTGDYLMNKMTDYLKVYGVTNGFKNPYSIQDPIGISKDEKSRKLDDMDAELEKVAEDEFKRDEQWLVSRMDQVSGNENSGWYVKGSHGEKAHADLAASYEKTWAREEELMRENGIDRSKVHNNGKQYAKLREVCESDKLWKALNAADKKNEEALIGAVLKDLGFTDTPEARYIVSWYVFLD